MSKLSALVKTLCALITYVLVEAVFARQSLPLSGAVHPVGRLNVVTRSLVPPAAPLRVRQNAAFLAAASGSPPGRLKPPCPSRGLACRCVPPRQLGRAVGLTAYLSYAVWAKPSALFVLSGCSRQPPEVDSTSSPEEDSTLPLGRIPQTPNLILL